MRKKSPFKSPDLMFFLTLLCCTGIKNKLNIYMKRIYFILTVSIIFSKSFINPNSALENKELFLGQNPNA